MAVNPSDTAPAVELWTIDLPEDVLSLTVVLIDPRDQHLLIVTHLEGPDGQRLIDPMPASLIHT